METGLKPFLCVNLSINGFSFNDGGVSVLNEFGDKLVELLKLSNCTGFLFAEFGEGHLGIFLEKEVALIGLWLRLHIDNKNIE